MRSWRCGASILTRAPPTRLGSVRPAWLVDYKVDEYVLVY
jgi:hypothetical protein